MAGGQAALSLLPPPISASPGSSQCMATAPTCVQTLSSHKGAVHTAVYNSGCSYVLTGGQDRQIKLWNPKNGNEIKNYSGHGYEVLGIACTADNTKFASCGGDRNVFLWDVAAGETIRRYSGHLAKVNAVAFNKDATVLASGSFDTSIRLWDLKSQQRMPIQVIEDSKDSITCLVIRDHYIISGSVDGHVRMYDIRQGEVKVDFFDQPVTNVKMSQDMAMMLVTTLDSTVRILDSENGKLFTTFKGHKNTDYRSASAFGKGEAIVLHGDENGALWRWDVESGRLLYRLDKAHDKAILWTEAHAKENACVTASADGTVKVWNYST